MLYLYILIWWHFDVEVSLLLEVSNGLGHPSWPVAQHAKRMGQAGMTQYCSNYRPKRPKRVGRVGPKETTRRPT